MKRLNFTLVELLVVMAVILILSSLLFPALSHAKGLMYGVQCRSNMKMQYSGYMLYLNTYSGEIPSGMDIQRGITGMLKPELDFSESWSSYESLPKMWHCPGKKVETLYLSCGPEMDRIDYSMGYGTLTGKQSMNVVNPSRKVLGMDGAHTRIFHVGDLGGSYAWHCYQYIPGAGKYGLAEWPDYVWTRATASHDFFEGRHSLTVNLLFFSGNIEMRSAYDVGMEYHSPLRVVDSSGNPATPSTCFGNMFRPDRE